jgi:hypothetical protein
MSQKHNQRTRAEILAKRAKPIIETNRISTTGLLVHTTRKPERSIYMAHIGAKEQERAKRCYMETHFQPVEAPDERGFQTCHPRNASVLCQMSKATHEAYLEAREQEYESVF